MSPTSFIASVTSAVVAGIVLWFVIPRDEPPEPGVDDVVEIFHQEATRRTFTTRLPDDRPYTRVFGYLDFDASSDGRADADLMITVHFFADPSKPSEMRSLTSQLVRSNSPGSCNPITEDSDGSPNISIRQGQYYCIRSNQGRLVNFRVDRILTSWGANAEIEVQYSFETFSRD